MKKLHAIGLGDYQIAAVTGISTGTVQRWHHREGPPGAAFRRPRAGGWDVKDVPSYCYLLGVYLGDGWTTHRPPNGWTLKIACDARYEQIIGEVTRALTQTFPGSPVRRRHLSSAASEVISLSHPAIGTVFPQHGPGRKHRRKIELANWQRAMTHAHPDMLIRGLIHSDGCRCVNSFKTKLPSGRVAEYSYVRYVFTNYSADIRAIFIEHCEPLEVKVTQSNHRNLSVSHRKSVAVLEGLIGPKG